MRGNEYSDLIAAYIVHNFGSRDLIAYREVSVGKSIIGKNRRLDVMVRDAKRERSIAVQCKFQDVSGTTDEKIPYALDDAEAMRMDAIVVYGGDGWSRGVRQMVAANAMAARCLPDPFSLSRTAETLELDHVLAQHFGWWDVLVANKQPFSLDEWRVRALPAFRSNLELNLVGVDSRPIERGRRQLPVRRAAKRATSKVGGDAE